MEHVPKPCGRREQNLFEELKKVQKGRNAASNGRRIGDEAADLDKIQNLQDLEGQ